jgi:hypothetical protein
MRFHLHGVVAIVWLAVVGPGLCARAQKLATYHDPKYGVSFAYPAEWTADPHLGFYLETDILAFSVAGSGESEALMKVGFDNAADGLYPGTDLNGVEFVYFVASEKTQAACYAGIRGLEDKSQGHRKAAGIVIGGVSYLHLKTGDAGLGHGADRDLYAAYAGKQCYLFEAGIHTYDGDDSKPLTRVQYAALRGRLKAVMRSVRIRPSIR